MCKPSQRSSSRSTASDCLASTVSAIVPGSVVSALLFAALLSGTERRNGRTLAELAGDATPDGMQQLLNFHSWSADAVRDDLRGYVTAAMIDPGGATFPSLTLTCRHPMVG
jgi:hypothetical protein